MTFHSQSSDKRVVLTKQHNATKKNLENQKSSIEKFKKDALEREYHSNIDKFSKSPSVVKLNIKTEGLTGIGLN